MWDGDTWVGRMKDSLSEAQGFNLSPKEASARPRGKARMVLIEEADCAEFLRQDCALLDQETENAGVARQVEHSRGRGWRKWAEPVGKPRRLMWTYLYFHLRDGKWSEGFQKGK